MRHRDPLVHLLDDSLPTTTSTRIFILTTTSLNENRWPHHEFHVAHLEESLFMKVSTKTFISMIVDHHHQLEHNVLDDLDPMQPGEVVAVVEKVVPLSLKEEKR